MEFLGFTVDTVQMELKLPVDKIKKICAESPAMREEQVSGRALTQAGGQDECNITGDTTSPTIFIPLTDGPVCHTQSTLSVLGTVPLTVQGGTDMVGHPHDKLELESPSSRRKWT